MSNSDTPRAELEARNAAMRENMTSLLEGLDRQTEQLREAQAQALAATGAATSDDELVTVRVNSVGIVTGLDLAPAAFRKSTPEKLSRSIVGAIQAAANEVRTKADEAFAPMQQNLPDLPDFFPDAPSLKDLMPSAPDVPSTVEDEAADEQDDEDDEDDDEEKGRPW